MKVIINKARRRNNFYLPVDELIACRSNKKEGERERERKTNRERQDTNDESLLNEFEGGNTRWRRIALRRKYIFLRSVTAPTYQGREAAQGSNCQLTVINSLSQVAAIKPAISPSSGTGPNDHGSVSGQSNGT